MPVQNSVEISTCSPRGSTTSASRSLQVELNSSNVPELREDLLHKARSPPTADTTSTLVLVLSNIQDTQTAAVQKQLAFAEEDNTQLKGEQLAHVELLTASVAVVKKKYSNGQR